MLPGILFASRLPLPSFAPCPQKGGRWTGRLGVLSCFLLGLRTGPCSFAFQGQGPKCCEPGAQDSRVRPWARGGRGVPATLLGQLLSQLPGPVETSTGQRAGPGDRSTQGLRGRGLLHPVPAGEGEGPPRAPRMGMWARRPLLGVLHFGGCLAPSAIKGAFCPSRGFPVRDFLGWRSAEGCSEAAPASVPDGGWG